MGLYYTEYDWMWNELGLSLAESRLFGYIHGLTNSKRNKSKVKGYKGSLRNLAKQLRLDHSGVSKMVSDMIDEGILAMVDGVLVSTYKPAESVESVPISVESVPTSGESVPTSVESVRSPHTPLYNKSQKKEINIIQSNPKDMDGGEVSPDRTGLDEIDNFSLELFTQYYRLFPHKAKSTAIKQATQNEFCALSHETQQALIGQLRRGIDDGVDIHPRSPLLYLRSFVKPPPPPREEPDGEPHNYNHEEPPKDKFLQPAFYKGEWGMYCMADIIKFNLLTKEKMNQPQNQEQ